ncbi:MAG: CoA-transferase, partial [Bacillota bacterium]|nr:CoA-transferase [Bacillota bacterium]
PMFQIMSPEQAVGLIKDGDCIAINSFLALANPNALHTALAERFRQTGHPCGLELFCSSGFGGWDPELFADQYISQGAVRKVVASHFASMPVVQKMAAENRIECYCLPLGTLSQCIRAAAAGQKVYLSKVGLNIFSDPRLDGPALNSCSKEELVKVVRLEEEEYLLYKTPKIDVAFIKGTTVDPHGNISFENEPVVADALAMAQATKNNGGKVIVQVEKVSHLFKRPWDVVVPGVLVDAVVVSQEMPEFQRANPVLSGDIHVPASHMDYWMGQLRTSKKGGRPKADQSADIIGRRAAREMKAGDVVNIGIGIPETTGKYASELGVLKDVTLTVEAGGTGGLPAPGVIFGSTIGADMATDMASQFDFYDGGGLDICFMGGVEADCRGNVNAHRMGDTYTGIGGFANITAATKTVIFCLTFSAKGLSAVMEGPEGVRIESEGSVPKFKKEIAAVSFSAKNALQNGQRVLYVTERCVFGLTPEGLALLEVYPGIDKKKDVLDRLEFPVKDLCEVCR